MPEYCEIKFHGHLDPRWLEWFVGLELEHLEGDVTLLSGLLPDQAAVYGLLERARDLNLVLISVTCGAPSNLEAEKRARAQDGQPEEETIR